MPSNPQSPTEYDGGGSLGSAAIAGQAAIDFAAKALSSTDCNFQLIVAGDSFVFEVPQMGGRTHCDLPSIFDWTGCEAGGLAGYFCGATAFQDVTAALINNDAHPSRTVFTHPANTTAAHHDKGYVVSTPGLGDQTVKQHIQTTWRIDLNGHTMQSPYNTLGGGQHELFSQRFRARGTNDAWGNRATGFDPDASFALRPVSVVPPAGGSFALWYLIDDIANSDSVAAVTINNYPWYKPGQGISHYNGHADDTSVDSPAFDSATAGIIRRPRMQGTTAGKVTDRGDLKLNGRTAAGEPGVMMRTATFSSTNVDVNWSGGLVYVYDDSDSDRCLDGPIIASWGYSSISLSQMFDDSSEAVGSSLASDMTQKNFSVAQFRNFLWALDVDPTRDRFVVINCDVEAETAQTTANVRQVMYGAWESQHDTDGAAWTGRTGRSGVVFYVPHAHIVTTRTEAQSHSDFQALREAAYTVMQEMEAEGKYVGIISGYDALGGVILSDDDFTTPVSTASAEAAAAFVLARGGDAYAWGNGNTTDLTALSTTGGGLLDTFSLHPASSVATTEAKQASGAFITEYSFKAALSITGEGGSSMSNLLGSPSHVLKSTIQAKLDQGI